MQYLFDVYMSTMYVSTYTYYIFIHTVLHINIYAYIHTVIYADYGDPKQYTPPNIDTNIQTRTSNMQSVIHISYTN